MSQIHIDPCCYLRARECARTGQMTERIQITARATQRNLTLPFCLHHFIIAPPLFHTLPTLPSLDTRAILYLNMADICRQGGLMFS